MRVTLPSLLLLAFLPTSLRAAERPVAFVGVHVVPMTAETVLEDRTVIVRRGRIDAIGPRAEVPVPRRATRIEGKGRYLMPGLADLHVHLMGGRTGNPQLLEMYALNGVTTVLNMRGTTGTLALRERIEEGELLGPTLYTTSPILGNVSPHPKTREEGEALVERFAAEGYDLIKVYNQIPADGYEGIMAAAERVGIPVIGHAVRSVGLDGAIRTGQHIAHMEEVIYGHFGEQLDESGIAPLAERIREAGIAVTPNLVAYHHIILQVRDIEGMLRSPGVEYTPEAVRRPWQAENNDYLKRFDLEEVSNRLAPSFAFLQKLTLAFQQAGIPLLLGTDSSIPIVVAGYSAHQELAELVQAGLTPYEALLAGTRTAAEFLGASEDFGTVEVGKRADLVLVDGNPLLDIEATQKRHGVMVRGRWLEPDEIERLLADGGG